MVYVLTLIHSSSILGQSKIVELLIQNGANIEATDHHGSTALRSAAEAGNFFYNDNQSPNFAKPG